MSTLPSIQPHTEAKHHILRYYLDEWFPILGRTHRHLLYIDGFAGPGEYEGGQPGSPIIAMRTIERHRDFMKFSREDRIVEFLFVEKDPNYHRSLTCQIGGHTWPHTFKINSRFGEFEEVMTGFLDDVRRSGSQMPPTLTFIDPFGPAGFSMEILKRLASFDRMDVLINLNYNEFVQWILTDSSKHMTADRLYGGPRWRQAIGLTGRQRAIFLVDEYKDALREIGWRGTSFEMVNVQNQTAYHLIFGTHSGKGMEAMKRAMRAASPTGEFRYADRVGPDHRVIPGLDIASEYSEEIGEHLYRKYDGQEVSFNRLMTDEIDWHSWWLDSDLRKALTHLEYGEDQRITDVRNADGRTRRSKSYPDGCLIRFGKPLQRKLI